MMPQAMSSGEALLSAFPNNEAVADRYEKKLSEAKAQLSMLEQQYDNEGSLQRRLADFRKALSKNQMSMRRLQTRQKQHFCHICPMI